MTAFAVLSATACPPSHGAVYMTMDQIRSFVRRQPFLPFTMHLADGRSFPVEHQDFLAIPPPGTRNMTAIVYHRDGTFDFVYVKLITSITSSGPEPTANKTDDEHQ